MMHPEDIFAILSVVGLIVICIWFRIEKKKLIDFFNDLTDEKKSKAH